MKFTKTLKFRMAMWYSVILLIFCVGFLVVMNVLLTNYLRQNIERGPFFGVHMMYQDDLNDDRGVIIKEARENDIENIRILSEYALVPFVILSFVGGYFIAERNLKPLEDLRLEMNNKSTHNLGKEIVFKDKEDEISDLIKSFNRMSKHLGESFDSQKEFVENASHELKTPLAIIQANIESILEDGKISEKELRSMLEDSKKSVSFMNKLTEDLLLLSLVDTDFDKEEVNILDMLNDIKNQVSKLENAKSFEINVKGDNKLSILANRVLLERAIQNIVENSIKYSGGSKIDIELKKEKNILGIKISDNGNGIPKESQEKIFERFYRVDKSRSRKTGGCGLGLAITKDIINKHNGTVKYIDSDKGATFVVEFKA